MKKSKGILIFTAALVVTALVARIAYVEGIESGAKAVGNKAWDLIDSSCGPGSKGELTWYDGKVYECQYKGQH